MSERAFCLRRWAALATVLLAAAPLLGQFNPNGFIRTRGWNFLGPILNPSGATGGGAQNMLCNWVGPHQIGLEDPKAGTEWPDISFTGACAPDESRAPGYDIGNLNDVPIWTTLPYLEAAFGLPAGALPSGDLVDYGSDAPGPAATGLWDWINGNVIPALQAGGEPVHALPTNNVLAIATTYVQNNGPGVEVDVCTASDDSIQVWFNNIVVANVSAARGSSPDCQELNRGFLPSGITKITTLVWEGGGGHNFRLGIRLAGAGTNLKDGNGTVEFLGPGGPATEGQVQYVLERSTTASQFNCPNLQFDVTLDGTSPPGFPGADGDLLTVHEKVSAPVPNAIEISGVTNGGVVSSTFPTETPVGDLCNRTVVGAPCGAGSGTTAAAGPVTCPIPEYTSTAQTGGDIWDGGDVFEFAFCRVSGDFDVALDMTSKVHSLGSAPNDVNGRWGKFGIMARKSLQTDARFTMVQDHLPDLEDNFRAAGRTVQFGGGGMYEDGAFAAAANGGAALTGHPRYFRLTRRGNVVQCWASDDGTKVDPCLGGNPATDGNWSAGHADDWGEAPPVFLGFANSEHNSGPACSVQTIKFQLINAAVTLAGPHADPINKVITWTDVPRSAVNAGLGYTLKYTRKGTVTLSGNVEDETLTQGPSSFAFDPGQSGPVGEWLTSHDIGSVPTVGSTTYDAATGTYISRGTGADIWDGGDDFHYAYKEVAGDFLAECRIRNVDDPGAGTQWGRFGLMARWTCDRNSKYSMIVELGSDNVDTPRHQFRVSHLNNGGTRDHYQVDDGFFASRRPAWMRLVRRGKAIYSFLADSDEDGNPGKWCAVGSDSAPNLPDRVLLGFAVSAHGSAGVNLLSITYDRLLIKSLDAECADLEPLNYEHAATNAAGLGSTPYTPRLVTARIPTNTADAIAQGGSGLGVKNRNWVWRDLTVGSEDLAGTLQLLWNNENRNFNPDGAGNPAVTPLLRYQFPQVSRVFIAWDARLVKGGGDNPNGTVNNGWFDFNNDVGTFNAQGWLRIGGSSVVDPSADIIKTNDSADGGDDNFARGGVWCKDFGPGEVLETYQTGYAPGRSPYVVFVRCGQSCAKAAELANLDFSSADQMGIAVQGGGFAPAITGGRLRVSVENIGSQANAVWYGVSADSAAEGFPVLDEGFIAEFDAFMTRANIADPADGMAFAVVATGVTDGLVSAIAPFPTGLDVRSLRGDGGGAIAYEGATLRQRTECHPNFAIELDNWVGGGEPGNEPADGGSPNFDGNYHVGLDVNSSVSSTQTNVDFGVPTTALPNIFDSRGVHVELQYRPDGAIDVWVSGFDRGGVAIPRLKVLSSFIPPLPSGDVVVGFLGATGGATCTTEFDNFKLSGMCCEFQDSVAIAGSGEGTVGSPISLSATLAGADDHGANITYSWEVVSGEGTIDDATAQTINVTPTASVELVVRVTANDGRCDGASADHHITVAGQACDLSLACTVNPDEISVHVVGTVTGPNSSCDCDEIVVRRDGAEIFRGPPPAGGAGDFPLPEGCTSPTEVVYEVACVASGVEGAVGTCSVTCPAGGGTQFPGDCNQDGRLSLSDVICILNYLFLGEDPVELPCGDGSRSDPANLALLDANGDLGAGTGVVDMADAIYLLNRIAFGGPAHVLGESCVRIVGCPDVSPCPSGQ